MYILYYIIHIPAGLGDDHFGTERVELLPESLHLQLGPGMNQLCVQRPNSTRHLQLCSLALLTICIVPLGLMSVSTRAGPRGVLTPGFAALPALLHLLPLFFSISFNFF